MEIKQPVPFLERIQNGYQEFPQPFWVLMTGTFIDRLGTNLIIPFLAMVLITLGEMLVIPTSQALTALLAPPDMRAHYIATERFNWIIAQALAPLAAGAVMDRLDPLWVWYGCSILCAISILGFYGLHLQARDRLMQEMGSLTIAAVVVTNLASCAGSHEEEMNQKSIIIFVCEHGAAKSVIATAYFNTMRREKDLSLHAIARGTDPDAELSPITVAGLREDGLTPGESIPRKLSREDIESAQRIVSFCDLPGDYHQKAIVEQWDDIPPVSEDYQRARDAIVARVQKLIEYL